MSKRGPQVEQSEETHDCCDSGLFGKSSCVTCDHCQRKRKIGRESNDKTVPHEARPNIVGIDLSNHDCANQGHYSVECHPICTGVFQIGAADGRNYDENDLESGANHLDKKSIKCGETESFDNNRCELMKGQVRDDSTMQMSFVEGKKKIKESIPNQHRRWAHFA